MKTLAILFTMVVSLVVADTTHAGCLPDVQFTAITKPVAFSHCDTSYLNSRWSQKYYFCTITEVTDGPYAGARLHEGITQFFGADLAKGSGILHHPQYGEIWTNIWSHVVGDGKGPTTFTNNHRLKTGTGFGFLSKAHSDGKIAIVNSFQANSSATDPFGFVKLYPIQTPHPIWVTKDFCGV